MEDRHEKTDDSGAAIVCHHVAAKGYPILVAFRDEPIEPTDSGWQFLCGSGEDEEESKFQVWSVREVTEDEPSLTELIDLPSGTSLSRVDREGAWKIAKF